MFSEFYQIPSDPFSESPDPRFLYSSSVHARLLAELLERVRIGSRLEVLAAAPGLGKTTIAQAILLHLRDRAETAFVFNTICSPGDLLGFLLLKFGVAPAASGLPLRRQALDEFVEGRWLSGRKVIAVVDEAQHLDREAMQELGALLTRTPVSFQLILLGQSELASGLASAPDELRAWLGNVHRLVPLESSEIMEYVRHRLFVAGYAGREIFTNDATAALANASSGVPRIINILCSVALELGAARRQYLIDSSLIFESLARLHCASTDNCRELTEKNDAPRLGEILRHWLHSHAGRWSGTAGELQIALRQGESKGAMESSSAELADRLQGGADELLRYGIHVELRQATGQPNRWILRLSE